MMLADVGIAVMMKLVMNDASFLQAGQGGLCSLLTMTSLGNGGIDMPTIPQLRRRQTGVSEKARYHWSLLHCLT
jgi:hypothetical protein